MPNAPLILISHRNGESHWAHRDLALRLAREGFRVVLADYPGDKRYKENRGSFIDSMLARPDEFRAILDFLEVDAAAIIGHSLGANTLLGLAGGISPLAHATGIKDPRIRCLIFLTPTLTWFRGPEALAQVRTPILMITADLDEYHTHANGEIFRKGLPASTTFEHHMVPYAGNSSFESSDFADRITAFLRRHIFFPLASSAKS